MNDFMVILNEAFHILVPLAFMLGIASLATFISAQKRNIKKRTDNEIALKYVDMLEDTIMKSVIATSQTYVDDLKDKDAFDIDAQKEAFAKSYNAVIETLTEEAKIYLDTIIGDLESYITSRIEYNVNMNNKLM